VPYKKNQKSAVYQIKPTERCLDVYVLDT